MARRQHRDHRLIIDVYATLLFSELRRHLRHIVHPHDGLEVFDATLSRLAFALRTPWTPRPHHRIVTIARATVSP